MVHELKIEKNYLQNLLDGKKKAEIRYNDRDYQVGDTLAFNNYGSVTKEFFEITHIHSGLGLREGYVVLSLKPCHVIGERE